ncbi:MBL fold metallo-hydrolase [Streptomyces gobiensis]|uniref:MBL fold metallo-hydrolase n=1 Tax=Streptomyces gobiensis TaxID=2875706 RepID=UPI001E44E170|nr:MBL fold metallo-hydrolase [Streptomyces gobiensis]UGY92997.1 MBL fold metallo-hydrolase [Streptomyces gobiensis]
MSEEPRLTPVADNVYAWIQPDGGWCLNNSGVVVGGDGAIVVDTAATVARAERLRAQVDAVAPGSARTLVNTHFHGDHTFGNAVFGPEAAIVAHAGTREEMAATGLALTGLWPDVEWGSVQLALPTVTYEERMTLHLGERRAELIHVGPAHTRNDTVVWLPEERVLFTGDVVLPGCTPFVLMGTVAGSLRALDELRALDPRTVIGGHGPVAGGEAFDATEAYLRWVQDLAAAGVARGLTALETARTADLGAYAALTDPERLVGNLHRARAELEDGELARPLDVAGIFQEMVEFNGGQLMTCRA